MTTVDLRSGDCIDVLKTLPDSSVDAVVCDPPYGLSNTKPAQVAETITEWATGNRSFTPSGKGFMNASWDGFVPPPAVWDECLRVLKPGGHMAVFAGARTQHLMGLSVTLAGFEIRDGLSWITGTGFPKGQDLGKSTGLRQWDGWNSQLKPSQEPIILARKPFKGTIAGNVMEWGTGAINIDACRVATDEVTGWEGRGAGGLTWNSENMGLGKGGDPRPVQGRFPANVLLDEHAAAEMDEQSGITKSTGGNATHDRAPAYGGGWDNPGANVGGLGDTGGASRFFPVFKYQAKAPKKERPVIVRDDGTKIQHATVKPLTLMEWLVELITPPNGVVLDPFAGSGTTLEAARSKGFHAIGIEREPDYIRLIETRLGI